MRRFTLVVLLGIYSLCSFAHYKYSYDEGKVPEYVLPDVLVRRECDFIKGLGKGETT